MSELPTLRSQPHLYLKNRAERTFKLVELNAPESIVRGELELVEQAIASLREWLDTDYEKTDGDDN